MKEPEVLYNTENANSSIPLGAFPAHVVDLKIGKRVNNATPFNFTVKFDAMCKDIEVEDSEGKKVKATSLAGKTLQTIGAWFTRNPRSDSDNNRYVRFAEACGVEFEESEDKIKALGEIEPLDVLGAPVIAMVRLVQDSRDKDKPSNERRAYPKVVFLSKWEDGVPLDPDQILAGF